MSEFVRVTTPVFDLFYVKIEHNGPFLSCLEPHCECNAKCKVFHVKISFPSYVNKTSRPFSLVSHSAAMSQCEASRA